MALKSQRFFLCNDADSYVHLFTSANSFDLKLTDCNRTINWEFYFGGNKSNLRKAKRKLKRFRDLINTMYEELDKKE